MIGFLPKPAPRSPVGSVEAQAAFGVEEVKAILGEGQCQGDAFPETGQKALFENAF